MTKQEGLIVSAYTGFLLVQNFGDVHEFIEKTLERPVFTHELANDSVLVEIREKLYPKIVEIIDSQTSEE
jgi:hypothetical protein